TGTDNSAELYDPATNTATLTGVMTTARSNHSVTRLQDGTVLVVGGRDGSGNHLATAEIYDPNAKTFSATAGPLSNGRELHTATLLPDGRVLIAGGLITSGPISTAVQAAEIYDPVNKTFSSAGNMVAARWNHTATLLGNGKVLFTGGFSTTFGQFVSAE